MGSSPNDTSVTQPSSQAVGMQTPENSSGIMPSQDTFTASPTYRDQHPFMGAVQEGLLAFGQGLTDQPFLTQHKTRELEKRKQAFEEWSSTKSPQAKAMAEIYKNLYGGASKTNKTLLSQAQIDEGKKLGATHYDDESGQWLMPVK